MLQLKVRQYLHRSLLRVLDGLRLAAEEGVHLCLSLIVFGNTDFKYLNALFRDVFLKCKGEVKEKKATMSVKLSSARLQGFKSKRAAKDMLGEEGSLRAHTVSAQPLDHLSACS